MRRALLIASFALALPAFLLTHASFEPFEARFRLDPGHPTHAFDLPAREALYLEYVLTLRSPQGAGPTLTVDARPAVTIELNGQPAATLTVPSFYASHQDKILLSFDPVRVGRNELRLVPDATGRVTFDLEARLQNYSGIAPDFPRVAIVADASVTSARAARPLWRGALVFIAFYAASVVGVLVITRSGTRRGSLATCVLLASPSLVLSGALAYSLATPRHIWLSPEALGVAVGVGLGVGVLAIRMADHPAGVRRFAAVTAVSLISLEIALRVFNMVSPSFVFYSDAYSRYRGKPGAAFYDTRFNLRGFNDTERTLTRPSHVTRRIVAIGDSFAVGVVPYNDNYLTLLEPELAADGSTEVVNMGVAGTEPRDYLSILVNEGLMFTPDLVLVGLFIGNDFETPARKWYERSYVATLGHAVWSLFRERAAVMPTDASAGTGTYRDDVPSLSRDRFLEIEVDRAWVYEKDAAALVDATARVARELTEMHAIARKAGADFVVVLIPDEAQINVDLQATVTAASGRTRDQLDFDRPNRLIADALKSAGIRTLDLLPIFQDAGRATRLYKPQDTHWNLAGNQLAAKAIGAFLR